MRIILGAGPVRGVRRDEVSGLYPKRGTIEIGADADIVIWDPKREKTLGVKTLHMNVDYSPFEGKTVVGTPAAVLSRGDLIVKDDIWVGKRREGRGDFLKRGTFAL